MSSEKPPDPIVIVVSPARALDMFERMAAGDELCAELGALRQVAACAREWWSAPPGELKADAFERMGAALLVLEAYHE